MTASAAHRRHSPLRVQCLKRVGFAVQHSLTAARRDAAVHEAGIGHLWTFGVSMKSILNVWRRSKIGRSLVTRNSYCSVAKSPFGEKLAVRPVYDFIATLLVVSTVFFALGCRSNDGLLRHGWFPPEWGDRQTEKTNV